MALLRWDPWGELAALQRDVNQAMSRSMGDDRGATAGGLIPAIDAYRTDEALVVHVELPGLRHQDIDVSVQDNVLTLSGERRRSNEVTDDAWLRRERAVGVFERSFSLPDGTDPDAIQAEFSDGVLELRIPHPPEQKPRRIKVGGGEHREAIDVG